jgi:hypothetical protein
MVAQVVAFRHGAFHTSILIEYKEHIRHQNEILYMTSTRRKLVANYLIAIDDLL